MKKTISLFAGLMSISILSANIISVYANETEFQLSDSVAISESVENQSEIQKTPCLVSVMLIDDFNVKFLDKYDDLSGIYKDYLSVIEDDLYGLVTLSGSVVFKTDSKSNYAATDDGYIVNNSDITIYKHNKKKVYQNEDWYAIIIHRGE